MIRDGVEIPVPTPEEEGPFQDWLAANQTKEPFHPEQHYDYVGAFRAGINRDETAHLPDTYKLPGHPTFSNESMYYKPGMQAVRWVGDNPVPIETPIEALAGTTRQISPEFIGDPNPFGLDKYVSDYADKTPDSSATTDGFAKVIYGYSKAFRATGYNTAAAVNRGIAAFSAHLGQVQKYIELSTGMEHGTLWEDAAKVYEENTQYWQKRVNEVGGVTFLDEILSEAIGGFVPGVSQFALDVASGLTFPYMDGAVTAYEKGESPFLSGMEQAARTGILAGLFRMIGPLNQYLRAPIMGTIFGMQEAEVAPEGQRGKAFAKGFGIGAGYSMTSPGGRMGLNDVEKASAEYYAQMKEFNKRLGEWGGWKLYQRIEEPGLKPSIDKPQGLYTSPYTKGIPSPHSDIGGETFLYERNPNAKVLTFEDRGTIDRDIAIRRGSIGAGSGVWAARELLGKEEFSKLKNMTTKETLDYARKQYPEVDWERYLKEGGDRQDIIEGIGGIEARKAGYDAIELKDVLAPEYTEYVALNEKAMFPHKEPKPGLSQEGKWVQTDPSIWEFHQGLTSQGMPKKLGDIARGSYGGRTGYHVFDAEGKRLNSYKTLAEAKDSFQPKPGLKVGGFLGEQGGADFQKKPRKFLQTVEEAEGTQPELVEKLKGIKPQDYIVEHNAEMTELARNRIQTGGIDKALEYLKEPPDLTNYGLAELGATYYEMIKHFEKQGDYNRASELADQQATMLTQMGKFIQSAARWSQLSSPSFIKWANKQLDSVKNKYGWADTLFKNKPETFILTKEEQTDIMKRWREMKEMPDGIDKIDATLQIIDIVAKKVPPSISEMFDAYRYQNMLSSPKTQMRNISANMLSTFMQRPVDIGTVAAIDYMKSVLKGKEREHYINDVPVYLKTVFNAVPNAVEAFKNSIKLAHGEGVGKPELGIEAHTAFEKARLGQMPTSLTLVQRFMEASDKFNIALISAGEFAINKKNGMNDAEAYQKANEIADVYLLRSTLEPGDPKISIPSKVLASVGDNIGRLRTMPGIGPIAKFFIPFIKTPVNLGIQMIEHSPIGFARTGFSTEEIAKPLVGSLVATVGAMFAAFGETTWSPPTDPKDKEIFYATKRKPWSIKIGDTWVPVWYTGMYALGLGIPMAIKHYVVDEKRSILKDGYEQLGDALMSLAKFMGQQTSTQSIGALFSALDGDLDYKFTSQAGFTIQQVIPFNALVRYVNTIVDPVFRKPEGFWENIEKDMLFRSKLLEPRTTPVYGEIAKRDMVNYFVPYDLGISDKKYEPIYQNQKQNEKLEYLMNKLEYVTGDKDSKPVERTDRMIEVFEKYPKALKRGD